MENQKISLFKQKNRWGMTMAGYLTTHVLDTGAGKPAAGLRIDLYRVEGDARTHLKTVTTNLSINHLQRYRKRWSFFSELLHRDGDESGDAPEVEFPAPEDFFSELDAADRREWVQQALAKLPDKQRVPLALYHFEELSYEQIAARLGVSLSKVKTDILRARQALAQHLARATAEQRELNS